MLGRVARALALLCCCGLWSRPASVLAAAVTGEVYDIRTGAVVPEATVALGSEKAEAGPDGTFKLLTVPRGPGRIVARAPGYAVTVIQYLPVVPTPDEVWQNLPLMPLATAAPYDGGFIGLFFERAPLYEPYEGCVAARRLDDLPWGIRAEGVDDEGRVLLAAAVETLNERWGTAIFEIGATGEADVELAFGASAYEFRPGGPAGPRAAFEGGVTEDNLSLVRAFLRKIVLTAGEGVSVTREDLKAEEPWAEDLDAAVDIIYRERADFNYAIFKRQAPERFSLLTDLYLAIGGYDKHGVKDESGAPVDFPLEYQMGQVTFALGGVYRNVWAKAGLWFAGIWESGAEDLYEPVGGSAEKVLRRNFSSYYRAGYRFGPTGGVRVSPFGGYRKFSVRGKYRGKEEPGGIDPPLDIDYTTHYDGPEAGVSWDLVFGWYNFGVTGEYARVFANEAYNLTEIGLGVTNRIGVGTFAFARFYWGPSFDYTFGGLAMKIDVPF